MLREEPWLAGTERPVGTSAGRSGAFVAEQAQGAGMGTRVGSGKWDDAHRGAIPPCNPSRHYKAYPL